MKGGEICCAGLQGSTSETNLPPVSDADKDMTAPKPQPGALPRSLSTPHYKVRLTLSCTQLPTIPYRAGEVCSAVRGGLTVEDVDRGLRVALMYEKLSFMSTKLPAAACLAIRPCRSCTWLQPRR